MDASNWIALAAVIIPLGACAVGYGVLKQKVDALKEADANQRMDAKAAEALQAAAMTKVEARVTACEAGHANTAQEMNALRVDVAILTERSGTTVSTLDRIERLVTPDSRPAPRSRAAAK